MLARIGRCIGCGTVGRRDYVETMGQTRGAGPFRRTVRVYGRHVGETWVQADRDATCPTCQQPHWHAQAIEGRITATRCDARCTGATGTRCDCACGGANHGRDYGSIN